jgi:hypothetical protein
MKAGLIVLVCAVAAVLAGCGDDESAGDEQTLTYTEGKGEFNPIGDITRRTTPPGSGFTLTIPLEDDSGAEAGKLYAVCVATEETSGEEDLLGVCTATADFDGSQLALNVGGQIGEAVTGSIVGGTGDYAGATGTFESPETPRGEKTTDTFTFTLP